MIFHSYVKLPEGTIFGRFWEILGGFHDKSCGCTHSHPLPTDELTAQKNGAVQRSPGNTQTEAILIDSGSSKQCLGHGKKTWGD